jgi:L-fuconolactonase
MINDMPIIDSHQHFWKFNPDRDGWITDNMAVLRRDFLPEELEGIYQSVGIAGCVAVQADQSEEETLILANLAAEHAFIKGVVGWTDLASDGLASFLDRYQQMPVIKGFRHIIQAEDAGTFLRKEDFCRGIGMLAERGFTYDILIYARQLPAARDFVARFPHQPFVVDHAAKPDIRSIRKGALPRYSSSEDFAWWKKEIRLLAAHPNVYCKVSGLVTEASWASWSMDDLIPFVEVLLSAFGTKRLMFGSDWPVCLLAASDYSEMWHPLKQYLSTLSAVDQEQICYRSAIEFYKLAI